MRIIILHPAISPDATLEDQDSLVQVEAIAAAIARLGWQPLPMECTLDLAAVRRDLLMSRGDAVVFNLVESLDGADSLQYVPAALLDALGAPYTGAPAEVIFQTTQKLLAKQLLRLAGLPTPAWVEEKRGQVSFFGPVEKNILSAPSEGKPFPGLPSPRPFPGGEGDRAAPSPSKQPFATPLLVLGSSRLFGNTLPADWTTRTSCLPRRPKA